MGTWEDSISVPNYLTIARLMLVVPIALLLLRGDLAIAGFVFAFAALTDFADGWIARHFNATSQLGRLLDPIADKLLVGTSVLFLWWTGLLPTWFALVVAAREIFVLGISAIARAKGRTEMLKPGPFGKAGSAAQMLLIALILLPVPSAMKSTDVLMGLMVIATALTVISAVRYVLRWQVRRGSADL